MRKVCVIDGVRTPFTKAGTVQGEARAVDLGQYAVSELVVRTGVDPTQVGELVAGNVIQPVDAVNIARVIGLKAQLGENVPAYTVHRNCSSGMQALAEGWMLIATGRADCVICLGVESMSDAPFMVKRSVRKWMTELQSKKMRSLPNKLKHYMKFPLGQMMSPDIGLMLGLTDPVSAMNMGQTAEKVAREFAISRLEQDEMAAESHRRAAAAWGEGKFADEVMATFPPPRYQAVLRDNGFREDSTVEKLGTLKPVFDKVNGSVTAANSSQITDGACAVMLGSDEFAKKLGKKPLGTMIDFNFSGLDPTRMGLGPVFSVHHLFKQHKIGWKDVDLVELNEAFAAQAIGCLKAMDSQAFFDKELNGDKPPGAPDWDRTNVNGGAIALGHPVGATGTRLVLTLLNELNRQGGKTGIATLCIGGGQGAAVMVEAGE